MYFPGKAQAVCKQDRHGRFPRIVNVPSDLFNSDVNFPSFTRSNNVQKTFLFSRVFLHKKMTEKRSQNVRKFSWFSRVKTQEWHEFRLRSCLQGCYQCTPIRRMSIRPLQIISLFLITAGISKIQFWRCWFFFANFGWQNMIIMDKYGHISYQIEAYSAANAMGQIKDAYSQRA